MMSIQTVIRQLPTRAEPPQTLGVFWIREVAAVVMISTSKTTSSGILAAIILLEELPDRRLRVPGVVDFQKRPAAERALGVDSRHTHLRCRFDLGGFLLQLLTGNLDHEVEQIGGVVRRPRPSAGRPC